MDFLAAVVSDQGEKSTASHFSETVPGSIHKGMSHDLNCSPKKKKKKKKKKYLENESLVSDYLQCSRMARGLSSDDFSPTSQQKKKKKIGMGDKIHACEETPCFVTSLQPTGTGSSEEREDNITASTDCKTSLTPVGDEVHVASNKKKKKKDKQAGSTHPVSGDADSDVTSAQALMDNFGLPSKKKKQKKGKKTENDSSCFTEAFCLQTSLGESGEYQTPLKKKKKKEKCGESEIPVDGADCTVSSKQDLSDDFETSSKKRKRKEKERPKLDISPSDDALCSQTSEISAKALGDELYTTPKKKKKNKEKDAGIAIPVSFDITSADEFKTLPKNRKRKRKERTESDILLSGDTFCSQISETTDEYLVSPKEKKRKSAWSENAVSGDGYCSVTNGKPASDDFTSSVKKKKQKKRERTESDSPQFGGISNLSEDASHSATDKETPCKRKKKKKKKKETDTGRTILESLNLLDEEIVVKEPDTDGKGERNSEHQKDTDESTMHNGNLSEHARHSATDRTETLNERKKKKKRKREIDRDSRILDSENLRADSERNSDRNREKGDSREHQSLVDENALQIEYLSRDAAHTGTPSITDKETLTERRKKKKKKKKKENHRHSDVGSSDLFETVDEHVETETNTGREVDRDSEYQNQTSKNSSLRGPSIVDTHTHRHENQGTLGDRKAKKKEINRRSEILDSDDSSDEQIVDRNHASGRKDQRHSEHQNHSANSALLGENESDSDTHTHTHVDENEGKGTVSEREKDIQESDTVFEFDNANQSVMFCYICQESVANKKEYIQHLAEEHKKKSYQCPKCMRPHSSEAQVKHHLDTCCTFKDCESMSAPYHCKYCPLSYSFRNNRTRHMRTEHKVGSPFLHKCKHCHQEFTSSNRVKLHEAKCAEGLVQKPSSEQSFECELCGKMFSSRPGCFYHIRTIHNQHVFDCVCGKQFRNSTYYYAHRKVCKDG